MSERQYGVVDLATITSESGLDFLQGMIAGRHPNPPMSRTVGFHLVDVSRGRAVFEGVPRHEHYNPIGTVHGGFAATLLDSALGCAVHTTLPVGKRYTTAELKINMVRPLTDQVPLVRAIGEVIHVGSRMATADARLVGADRKLYAHGSTTCFLFDAP